MQKNMACSPSVPKKERMTYSDNNMFKLIARLLKKKPEDKALEKPIVHCPINQRTGDGEYVGQCLHTLKGGVCPIHGDVTIAVERFELTGQLTKEKL